MRKLLLGSIAFFFTFSVHAKSDTSDVDSIAKREFNKRNEIYVNISPALIPMIGGASDLVKYSVKYKRIEETFNRAFRIGINYIKDESPTAYKLYTYDNDSTMVIQKLSASSSSNFWVEVGWEWVQFYKRFERFYGADAILGYSQSKTSVHQETYTLNNGLYNPLFYENINFDFKETRVGFSPFLGLKYHISQHFIFALQVGVDFTYNIVNSSNSKSGTIKQSNVDFKLGTPAFINDISLVYSF